MAAKIICKISGCGKAHKARGLCSKHYQRWCKFGDPNKALSLRGESAEIRFFAKVDKSGECWIWKGKKLKSGYGVFSLRNRSDMRSHRAAWEFTYGPIPEGLVVMHICDNKICCRIDHLRLGTQKQNLQDMKKKGRSAFGEKNGSTKLTESQARFIKNSDLKGIELSKMFNVGENCICHIRKGRNWKWVKI